MTIGVDAIIDRLGGAEAAARLTGVGTEAVRKWRQAGSIPSRHWAAVIAATGLALSDLPGGLAPPRAEPAVGDGDEVPLGRHGGAGAGRRDDVLGPRLRRPYRGSPRRWARSASTPA